MLLEKKDFEPLLPMINDSIETYLKSRENKEFEKKTFNKSETADIINCSKGYISTLIEQGYLHTTADGKRITGTEINRYLGQSENKKAVSNGNIETA